MKITDLFPVEDVEARIASGHVRRQTHPYLPLSILNYTEQTAWERAWDPVTRACRGLIVHHDGTVIARPFPKFFNFGEHEERVERDEENQKVYPPPDWHTLALDEPAIVTDKLDGSLGILYQVGANVAVATRGSFTSDQALHATQVWNDRYQGKVGLPYGVTLLFEIIYPGNRIVLDYRDSDDLYLLGGVDIASGRQVAVRGWPGPACAQLEFKSLREALMAKPRPNAEGYVVYFPDRNDRVKIKQEDYVRLHRLIFGLSKRRIWEIAAVMDLSYHEPDLNPSQVSQFLKLDGPAVRQIREDYTPGEWLQQLLLAAPDEFRVWAASTVEQISSAVDIWLDAAESMAAMFKEISPDRKAFAEKVATVGADGMLKAALFRLYDGKSVRAVGWLAMKPGPETFAALSEDTA